MTSSEREDRTKTGTLPSVAIVMPAYNAAHLLPESLGASLRAARDGEVIVVDPASTDDTAAVAESLGARVLRMGRRAGPAEARNVGVAAANSEIALFIDSDCVAHEDVVRRVQKAFAENPDLVSLTGSYDADPPDPGFFSQYMNLRHHHTHQRAQTEEATFWAGCGAVRVDAFRRCGGFDVERFPRPMIEDIDLGVRLREIGRTRLDPDLHVTHLKRWTMASVIRTDIFRRAIPWTRLILERQGIPNDLNLRNSQRAAALISPFALLSVPLLAVSVVLWPIWALVPLSILLVSLVLSLDLVRFFARRRGLLFALGAWLFHQVHLFYSAATFALVTASHRIGRMKTRP